MKEHRYGSIIKITTSGRSIYRGVCDCAWTTKDHSSNGEAEGQLKTHQKAA